MHQQLDAGRVRGNRGTLRVLDLSRRRRGGQWLGEELSRVDDPGAELRRVPAARRPAGRLEQLLEDSRDVPGTITADEIRPAVEGHPQRGDASRSRDRKRRSVAALDREAQLAIGL